MICPECGEEIADGMKFCGMCGTPVSLTKKRISCGTEMPARMKFCPECGVPQTLKPETKTEQEEPVAEETASEESPSEDDELLTVEKIEFEKIREQFYDCSCDNKTLLSQIEKIYEAHRTNKKVLDIYLPLLAETKDGAERALNIAESFNKDILSVYLMAVDIGIEQDNLSVAEGFLNKAKKLSKNDPLVMCRECCLMLAMYKQYKTQSFLNNALELSKTISEIKTEDIIVKSWQLRIMSLIMKQNGEKTPCFDPDFCKENNLIYRIVAWMDAIRTTEELKTAYVNALPNETLLLKPGTYQIDFSFNKAVTIKGYGETIFSLTSSKLRITSDLKLFGIKLVGMDASYVIDIDNSAKTDFENCIFDKCGVYTSSETEVSLLSCEICNVDTGLSAGGTVIFRNGNIHDITNTGIEIYNKSEIEDVKISNCGQNGIKVESDDAEISNCEISYVKDSGICVYEGSAKIKNCKVHDIESRTIEPFLGYVRGGFEVNGSDSILSNCEAYRCKISPESKQYYDEALDNYIEAIKEACMQYEAGDLPVIYDGSVNIKAGYGRNDIFVSPAPKEPVLAGFAINGENIRIENCKAYDNEDYGFILNNPQNITLNNCEAFNNYAGFSIFLSMSFKRNTQQDKTEDITFEKCKSYDNAVGFYILGEKHLKNIFTVLYRECESYRNWRGFSKGYYKTVIKSLVRSGTLIWDETSLGRNCCIEFENCKSDDINDKHKGVEIT